MKASVVIPTFGTRPDYLADVLHTAKKQDFPKEEYEILVVDNNPRSDVLSIVDKVNSASSQGPIVHVIPEHEIGLTKARHTGAQKAQADIVVYIGDDVVLHAGWLRAILEPFKDPTVACAGGKLIGQWELPKPVWFAELKHMAMGMLDLGEKTLELHGAQVWGDNMAVRKSVLLEVGGFNPDVYGGYEDKNQVWLGGDGECGLQDKFYQHGYKIIYEPRAWVYHRMPASRMTPEYFCRRSFIAAIGSSFAQIRRLGNRPFLPIRLLVQSAVYFLKSGSLFLKSRLVARDRLRRKTIAYGFYAKGHHQLRAVFSKKLRNHIFQESYL